MGKGRKSQYIKTLTNKDQNMLKAFRCVGYLQKEDITKKLEQSEKRLLNFERDKLIERVYHLDKKSGDIKEYYRLTEKGQEQARNQLNLDYFYRSNSPNHDAELKNQYFSLSQEEKDTWRTEGENRARLEEILKDKEKLEEIIKQKTLEVEIEKGKEEAEIYRQELERAIDEGAISPVDGSYISTTTGVEVAIEIVTRNYKEVDIQAKVTFTQIVQMEYQQYRA